MENSHQQPLLSPVDDQHHHLPPSSTSITTVFVSGTDDTPPITSVRSFFREFYKEIIKFWYIAGPAIFTMLCIYALGAITQIFLGHVSTIALAAFAVENMVVATFTQGVTLGMGSALETLCGQAVGVGQLEMLGIYMQRSWVISLGTACIMLLVYIFAGSILKLIGQTKAISETTGKLALWMISQGFAMAVNFPMQKFLQAQSKVMVVAIISAVALVFHVLFSWLLIIKLKWGLAGAAVVLNVSWWLINLFQYLYIISGTCGQAWTGFSWKAFHNLWNFLKLSLASAVMLVLESWYFMILVICAGYLKNAEISVDALSVCMNLLGWTLMAALGMNAAVSVRVSNELGAGHPRATKLSLLTAVVSSIIIGVVLSLILIITRNSYPSLFSSNNEVQKFVKELTPLLALSIFVNNIQPVLSGMAVGAGWQAHVAYVNICCYYVFGIPLGVILGLKLKLGVKGIWYGMLSGTAAQTIVLFLMAFLKNWNAEASVAGDRIKKWGGNIDSEESNVSESKT